MSKSRNNNYSKGGKNSSKGSKSRQSNNNNYRDRKDRTQVSDTVDKYGNSYTGCENDPSWYNRLQTLIHDVTRIPFTYQVGRPVDYRRAVAGQYDDAGNPEDLEIYDRSSPPGVMALEYIPIPGIATSATDGVNIAATGIFQNIRKNLSTVATYASADVMMYVLACDSILTMYNLILRNFGLINLYSNVNYNYNKSLYYAQGWKYGDITDFYENFSNYRTRFNNLIYKASTIYIPNTVSIMDRHAWLFSNVFIDYMSPKAQNYMHVCKGLWLLDEKSSDNGTALEFVELVKTDESGQRMKYLLDIFDLMIEAMRNSDSMNKIAADMRRAFPDSKSWQLAYCDEQYTIAPTYSKEVLSQVENTTILDWRMLGHLKITQSVDKNIIIFNPEIQTTNNDEINFINYQAWNNNQLINMHWDNPSSDDIAVATRNMVNVIRDDTSGTPRYYLDATGSDICVGAQIIKYTGNEYHDVPDQQYQINALHRFMTIIGVQDDNIIYNAMTPQVLADYISFDWAPIIYATSAAKKYGSDGFVIGSARALTDYTNYTVITPEALRNIHTNIIASMWNVPQLGDVQI